jgi:parallel beta-helix repeat protein
MKIACILIISAVMGVGSLTCHAGIINVKDFGAKGDGKTDDTKAIQAAINSAPANSPATIYFPQGVFVMASYITTNKYLENYFLLIHSNITFNGSGENSIIRLADHILDKPDSNANAHVFYGREVYNVKFTNLQIDLNGKNNMIPEGFLKNAYGIFIRDGRNVIIQDISIKNSAGRNMIIFTGRGSNVTIESSVLLNGGYYVGTSTPNKNQNDFSFIYSEWDSTSVLNNIIKQENVKIGASSFSGGIELHGPNSRAAGNEISGCLPGLYVISDPSPIHNIIVENNNLFNCVKGIIIWVGFAMSNITIRNNSIQIMETPRLKTVLQAGIGMPNGNANTYNRKAANNALVDNVSITNNRITSLISDTSETKSAGIVLHSLQNSTISDNVITGMNYGGIVLQGSKWGSDSIFVSKNKISAFKTYKDSTTVCGYILVTDTYSKYVKGAPGLKNIMISQNSLLDSSTTTKGPAAASQKRKFFGTYVSLPGSMIDEVHLDKNYFSNKNDVIKIEKTD